MAGLGLGLSLSIRRLLEDVSSDLRSQVSVRSIILFGSLARGEERKRSDIDLIVVSDSFPDSYSARLDMLRPILRKVQHSSSYADLVRNGYRLKFSPVPYKPEDLNDTPPLLLDVVEDGVIIYDDGLMTRKLSDLKEKLRSLGSKRIRTKSGKWYWVLKPDIKPGEILQI